MRYSGVSLYLYGTIIVPFHTGTRCRNHSTHSKSISLFFSHIISEQKFYSSAPSFPLTGHLATLFTCVHVSVWKGRPVRPSVRFSVRAVGYILNARHSMWRLSFPPGFDSRNSCEFEAILMIFVFFIEFFSAHILRFGETKKAKLLSCLHCISFHLCALLGILHCISFLPLFSLILRHTKYFFFVVFHWLLRKILYKPQIGHFSLLKITPHHVITIHQSFPRKKNEYKTK